MLENYEAAKEDRRAMCGDTGVPRWYVKIGNEARIEGGPVALEAALRRATANATHDVPLRPNRVHPLWRTDHNNNCRHRRAGDRILVPSRRATGSSSPPCTKAACSAPTTACCFPADGIDGIKRFYLDTLIAFGKRGLACQPAIVGVGLGGSKDISHGARQAGRLPAHGRLAQSRSEDRRAGSRVERARQHHRHGRHGLHGLLDGGRLPHRGRLLPHRRHADERAHVLPVLAPRLARACHADGRAEFRTDPEWFTDYIAARRRSSGPTVAAQAAE